MPRPIRSLALLFVVCLVCAPATAEEPKTVEVKRIPFGDVVEAKGTFVPADAHAIEIDVEAYGGPFEIEEVAPFGPVEEGQPLIRFKRKWYERQMERAQIDAELSRLKFELQEKSFRRRQVSLRLAKIDAERKYKRAQDDFAFFAAEDETMRFEEREQSMQSRRDRLENQREEYAQLEKMYTSDDLTEETEEIVLKRARRSLKRSEKSMKFSERRHERWLKKTRGRDREDRQLKLEQAKLSYEKVMDSSDAELEKAYLELKKARMGLRDVEEKLEKLKKDEAQLELRAPVQGVLHPGAWSSGWKGYDAMAEKLEAGERVKSGSPLMTILTAGPMHVETSVAEKDVLQVKAGLGAGITPLADKSTTLRAKVAKVSRISAKGKFAVKLAVEETDERIFPGMACEISIMVTTSEPALVVPATAIANVDGNTVVYVVGNDGPKPVAIVPGKARAGLVSVAKGLKEGEKVLVEAPKPDAKDKDDAKSDEKSEDDK
ncbi:MAG: HlyD family efflux transporter periplasmic adaptor subunit [Planctomycetota bacterium]|nr:HlyD family efflux transporter periplasmic adaptor subunit [Planctomycetota bacterium]